MEFKNMQNKVLVHMKVLYGLQIMIKSSQFYLSVSFLTSLQFIIIVTLLQVVDFIPIQFKNMQNNAFVHMKVLYGLQIMIKSSQFYLSVSFLTIIIFTLLQVATFIIHPQMNDEAMNGFRLLTILSTLLGVVLIYGPSWLGFEGNHSQVNFEKTFCYP